MAYFTNNFENAFGIDLSRFNTSADGRKQVHFDTIAAHKPRVVFAGMRAGISWGYQDAWFAAYFKEAQRVDCLRMPYHVVYPAESAVAQMDNFLRIVGEAELGGVRLVLDMELTHGCSRSRITATLNACLRTLERRTGRLPIVYSRAGWVDENLCVVDLPKLDWWLAQYRTQRLYPLFTPEYPVPPRLPKGVKKWLIHQSAERAPSIGAAGCYFMDYNRWNGSEADVRRYFEVAEPVGVRCPLDGKMCYEPVREMDEQAVALHLMMMR